MRDVKCAPSASSAPRPPSVVALPPTVTTTSRAPASIAGRDQLAGAATRGRHRVALARSRRRHSPEACACSTTATRPPSSSANAAPTSRPERVGRPARQDPAAARPHDRLHRALAAVGDRQQLDLLHAARQQPAADRARRLVRATSVPLNLSGATRTGRVTARATPAPPRTPAARPSPQTANTTSSRPLPAARWRRTSSTSIRAASSTGKPPTPVPNATSASERAPSSSAAASVAAVARADDVRRRRPAQLHRGRVDHPARGQLPGRRGDRLAEPDRRLAVALLLDRRAARAHDRAGHSAAVRAAACWPRSRSRPPRAS